MNRARQPARSDRPSVERFATTAAKRGKSLDAIMRQTLHKSESVARGYIRHAGMFEDNATVGLL